MINLVAGSCRGISGVPAESFENVGVREDMYGVCWPKFVVFVTLVALSGCMEPGDRGQGPACESSLAAAERDLMAAKANSIGSVIDWAKAAVLIGAARSQQQFNEFQNCVIKAKKARQILSVRN
jgi:hypothetical protein